MKAYLSQTLTWTKLGQLCASLWDSQSRLVVIKPGIEPGTVVMPLALRCTEIQCLRPLHHSGAIGLGHVDNRQAEHRPGEEQGGLGKAILLKEGEGVGEILHDGSPWERDKHDAVVFLMNGKERKRD